MILDRGDRIVFSESFECVGGIKRRHIGSSDVLEEKHQQEKDCK